jgi:hypothetical protein
MTVSKKLNDFNLDNDAKDNLIVPTSKIASNFVPIVGPVLAEIVGMLIPNQRQDRIADFLKHLQAIISEDDLERIKTLPERMEILEEGMLQAGLTPHRDRIPRIAQITAKGITQDEIDRDRISLLLETVKQVNTTDLILLTSYELLRQNPYGNNAELEKFQKKHETILIVNGEDYLKRQEKINFLKRYETHLVSLGLLGKIDAPRLDTIWGIDTFKEIKKHLESIHKALKSEYIIRITTLGTELLEYITDPRDRLETI